MGGERNCIISQTFVPHSARFSGSTTGSPCLRYKPDISFFSFPGLQDLDSSGWSVMAQVFHDKDGTKHHNMEGSSRDGSPVEKLEHAEPGYGHDRDERAMQDLEDENPNVYHHMCFKL